MQTATDFYETVKRDLPPAEQLRLARLILDALAEPSAAALEYCDHWSDEDLHDIAAFSMRCATESDADV